MRVSKYWELVCYWTSFVMGGECALCGAKIMHSGFVTLWRKKDPPAGTKQEATFSYCSSACAGIQGFGQSAFPVSETEKYEPRLNP